VGAVGREVCYATKEGVAQIRLGDVSTNVIFRKERIIGIEDKLQQIILIEL
jgi:hypothetical protein